MTIRLFATLRERAGASELTREYPDGATVAQIWQRLAEEFPALEGHRDAVRFAVNQEYVDDDYRPRPGDEIAFIPPVSGGADASHVRMDRSDQDRSRPIDVAALERAVADPRAGAIVTFVGTTRDDNVGRKVLRLEYEAYEAMALAEMRKLADEAGRAMENHAHRDNPSYRRGGNRRDLGRDRGLGAASRGGVRGVPLRDRPI